MSAFAAEERAGKPVAVPAASLDTVAGSDISEALSRVFGMVSPDVVYVPHAGDVQRDHQLIFQATMVCCRPVGAHQPDRIYAYETVSETEWYAPPITPAFVPNVFVDITPFIDRKLEAFGLYASQVRHAPDQRSVESLRAMSITRGHAMGVHHTEVFMLVRELIA